VISAAASLRKDRAKELGAQSLVGQPGLVGGFLDALAAGLIATHVDHADDPLLGQPSVSAESAPAPTWWAHDCACAWTAAWLTLRGRDWRGP
jgi:hypothetical protein